MGALTRSGLLARRPKTLTVDLDDGDNTFVRRLSAMDWERIKQRDPGDQNIPLQLAMVICDEDGTRQFDPDNPDDVKACGEAIALAEAGKILETAGKITANGTKEDAAKKSEASPSTDSASA